MASSGTVLTPAGGLVGILRFLARPWLVAAGAILFAGISALAILRALNGSAAVSTTWQIAIALICLTLGLGALIIWQVVRLWGERRSRLAGSRLHLRLVLMFSVMAVVPAIFVATFAATTLKLGIESWFSPGVRAALDNADGVARQYAIETGRGITIDAGEMADGIEHDRTLYDDQNHVKVALMIEKLAIMTNDRGLVASFLVDSHGNELASSAKLKYTTALKPAPGDIADAKAGRIVVDADPEIGIVHALIDLPQLNDAYLLAVRAVDPKVFRYYSRTKSAHDEYKRLETYRSDITREFAGFYAVVAFDVLLAAISTGLWFATRLARPISSLIHAAEQVSGGNLKTQVEVERDDDEVGTLGTTFNRMIGQLETQRSALVSANQQIDDRRRFTETVLAGVSAGVVGVDSDGQITIVNRAAARLLNASPEELEGRHYSETVPELAGLIRKAMSEHVGRASGEVTVKRTGTPRSLSAQVASEHGTHSGYVVTFDDITDLVSAQRTAAWADVARRIAHEIKNPLTPIQLSAERLKRKYSGEISSDPEVFEQCTNTIIRQVGDIGRMVDEFSSFARMPTPVMRRENAQELLQQAVFLQRVGNPQIAYDVKAPKEPVWFEGDGRLVSQALTNVIKNAGEGIASRIEKGDDAPGHVTVAIETLDNKFLYRVTDNGIGLPPEHRHRLTEPYVTTRVKGTGLGLAIVRKIMEDHGGEIVLQDRGDEQHGAEVTLAFPLRQKIAKEKGLVDEQERVAANDG